MRSYIFHHVLHGGEPIIGAELVKDIIETAKALPGYEIWCQHQYEIEHRATEWASCIESSHYFAYGEQFGKYKGTNQTGDKTKPEGPTWNQQQAQKTKDKIRQAVAQLTENGQLPEQATARFKALQTFGIGGGSLYRYKELWHPQHQNQQKSQPEEKSESGQFDCVGDASNCHSSTSLLPQLGGNTPQDKDPSVLVAQQSEKDGGNSKRAAIEKIRHELSQAQERGQEAAQQPQIGQQAILSQQARTAKLQQMAYWLTLEDPILMAEALAWLQHQPVEQCAQLVDMGASEVQQRQLEVIVEITQQLQRLEWSPGQIQESLKSHFQKSSLAHLTPQEHQLWLQHLMLLMVTTPDVDH
ncbi:MAG: hypothetical protein AAFU53_01440 [Cyanobacteria bacterium J06632_3]